MVRSFLPDSIQFSRASFLISCCELVLRLVFFSSITDFDADFLLDFSKSFGISCPQTVSLNDDINDDVCLPPRQLITDD